MNVKVLLVISGLLFCACGNKLYLNSGKELLKQGNECNLLIKFSVELPDTVYRGSRNIPILLKVENLAPEPIVIRDPRYWGNSFPYVFYKDKNMRTIKVKVDMNVLKNTVEIKEKETFNTYFNFSLDEIMDLEDCPLGQYEIYFVLNEVKSVKSQICTFYVADQK